jgi:hypothetical protein
MAGDRAILENFARGNTPSRDSVRRFMQQVVLDYCTQDPQKGEALVINTYQYSQDFDIRVRLHACRVGGRPVLTTRRILRSACSSRSSSFASGSSARRRHST